MFYPIDIVVAAEGRLIAESVSEILNGAKFRHGVMLNQRANTLKLQHNHPQRVLAHINIINNRASKALHRHSVFQLKHKSEIIESVLILAQYIANKFKL